MAVARKYIDKKLLHNVIRNTDAHNKIEEEKIMWRLHRVKSDRGYSSRHKDTRKSLPRNNACPEKTSSTHWMKELTDYESSLSDRWGHNGYKELYPEEFEDRTKDRSSEEYDRKRHRKRKKEKKDRKNKDRDSKRIRNKKKKSTSSNKMHKKRTSKKDPPRLEDKGHKGYITLNESLKTSTRKKKSRDSGVPCKEKGENVKRRKTEHE